MGLDYFQGPLSSKNINGFIVLTGNNDPSSFSFRKNFYVHFLKDLYLFEIERE